MYVLNVYAGMQAVTVSSFIPLAFTAENLFKGQSS